MSNFIAAIAMTHGGAYLFEETKDGLLARKVAQLHSASTSGGGPVYDTVASIAWVGGERIIVPCVSLLDVRPDTVLRLEREGGRVTTTSNLLSVATGVMVKEIDGDAVHLAWAPTEAWRVHRGMMVPLHDTDDFEPRPAKSLAGFTLLRIESERLGLMLTASRRSHQISGRNWSRLPGCTITAGVGWWPIICETAEKMRAVSPAIGFMAVDQSNGALRIRFSLPGGESDEARELLEAMVFDAANESLSVCEMCAQPGHRRRDQTGYAVTLCAHCVSWISAVKGWAFVDDLPERGVGETYTASEEHYG